MVASLRTFARATDQPLLIGGPNTVDNKRDVFRDRFGKLESFFLFFFLLRYATMIIRAIVATCINKKKYSIFAALFVERDHPVGIVNELSEKEGRKERR